MDRSLISRLLCFSASALALLAASGCNPSTSHTHASIAYEHCHLNGIDSQVRCGFVELPEDHSKPDGTRLKVHVAVIPSLAKFPEKDPVFFFAGGPGQAASDIGNLVSTLFSLRRTRDIVLVDQRGTGKSKTLTCNTGNLEPEKNSSRDTALIDTINASSAQIQAELKQCVATLKGNPSHHRTDDYIADLEVIRKKLGYDQINIWGGSYGSRVALRYMKLHPTSIRTAVIDGVAPTSLRLPNDALNFSDMRLRELVAACAKSVACAKSFPKIEYELDHLLTSLKASPRQVSFSHPANGRQVKATINDLSFASMLWPMLYVPEQSRMLPYLIQQANAGNFAPFAAMLTPNSHSEAGISITQRIAVTCAEDMAGQSPIANPRFGTVSAMFFEFCTSFPHGKVAPEFYEPTVSNIPTLILSGSLDPVTPAAQGELASKTLSRSKHVVVEGLGHIVSPHSCTRRLIKNLIETADIVKTQDACETELKLPSPLFYINALEAK